jgi:predicted DCC family thiol-disulfide oxidoreductase YuxK
LTDSVRLEADCRFEVFFDGECPLCSREVGMLRRRDREGRLLFTDIAAVDFDPGSLGLDRTTLMAKIHGRSAAGELVTGVEVFRRIYAALGFVRLVQLSRVPWIATALDRAYALFAAHRLRLTGRCEGNACELPAPRRGTGTPSEPFQQT